MTVSLRRSLVLLAVLFAMLVLPAMASAAGATCTWVGSGRAIDPDSHYPIDAYPENYDDWQDADNWSHEDGCATVPQSGDHVEIPVAQPATGSVWGDYDEVAIDNVPNTLSLASFSIVPDAGNEAWNHGWIPQIKSAAGSAIEVTGAVSIPRGTFDGISFSFAAAGSGSVVLGSDADAQSYVRVLGDDGVLVGVGEGRTLTLAGDNVSIGGYDVQSTLDLDGDLVVTDEAGIYNTIVQGDGAIGGEGELTLGNDVTIADDFAFDEDLAVKLWAVTFGAGTEVVFDGQVKTGGVSKLGANATVELNALTQVTTTSAIPDDPATEDYDESYPASPAGFEATTAGNGSELAVAKQLSFYGTGSAPAHGKLDVDTEITGDSTTCARVAYVSVEDGVVVDAPHASITGSTGFVQLREGAELDADSIALDDPDCMSGGVLGTGTVGGDVTIGSGASVVPDAATSAALEFGGALTFQSGSALSIPVVDADAYGRTRAADVTYGPAEIRLYPVTDPAFQPTTGATFDVLEDGGVDGTSFASTTPAGFAAGTWFAQSVVGGDLRLTTQPLATFAAQGDGTPGGSVTVVGAGFKPNETVRLEGRQGDPYAPTASVSTTTAASGTGAFTFVVPLTGFATGATRIVAIGSESGARIQSNFTLGSGGGGDTTPTTCPTGQTGTPPNCVTPKPTDPKPTDPKPDDPKPATPKDKAQTLLGKLLGAPNAPVASLPLGFGSGFTAFQPAGAKKGVTVTKAGTIPLAAVQCAKACRVSVAFVVKLGARKKGAKPVVLVLEAQSLNLKPGALGTVAPKLSKAQLKQLAAAKSPKLTVTYSTKAGTKTRKKAFTYGLALAKK